MSDKKKAEPSQRGLRLAQSSAGFSDVLQKVAELFSDGLAIYCAIFAPVQGLFSSESSDFFAVGFSVADATCVLRRGTSFSVEEVLPVGSSVERFDQVVEVALIGVRSVLGDLFGRFRVVQLSVFNALHDFVLVVVTVCDGSPWLSSSPGDSFLVAVPEVPMTAEIRGR